MREIKFRALIEDYNGAKRWVYYKPQTSLDMLKTDSDKEILVEDLQYTGLKDKNGKEIYEGDLTSSGFQIMFDDGIFCPFYDFGRQERWEDIGCNWWSGREIIGNIYQNPELLE